VTLLHPGIAARLLLGTAVTVALAYAAGVGARALVRWDPARASESQLALERRGHLAATLVGVALVGQIGALWLSLLLAERLTPAIRGAMCAYGVLASSGGGFASLGVSAAAAVAAAAWLSMDRVDARAEGLAILRTKLAWTIPLSILAAADLALTGRFLLGLDFSSVSSCCSVSMDAGTATASLGLAGGARTGSAVLAGGLGLGAAATSILAVRGSRRVPALLAGLFSLAAAAPALLAVSGWVAPHVYRTPAHLCPFCLLRAEHAGFGWALAALLFVAISAGASTSVAALLGRREGAADAAGVVVRRAARASAVAWALFLALAASPFVLYASRTGADLFG
jgi:hypothetical protein